MNAATVVTQSLTMSSGRLLAGTTTVAGETTLLGAVELTSEILHTIGPATVGFGSVSLTSASWTADGRLE